MNESVFPTVCLCFRKYWGCKWKRSARAYLVLFSLFAFRKAVTDPVIEGIVLAGLCWEWDSRKNSCEDGCQMAIWLWYFLLHLLLGTTQVGLAGLRCAMRTSPRPGEMSSCCVSFQLFHPKSKNTTLKTSLLSPWQRNGGNTQLKKAISSLLRFW